MDAGRVGNFANDGVVINVNDDDLGAVGDVKPTRGGIDGKIIPAASPPMGISLRK
jgi:hypothetical protein